MPKSERKRGAVARVVAAAHEAGRLTFSAEEVTQKEAVGGRALGAALRRYASAGGIARASAGLFVIVPPEFRAIGSPPVEWWLDDLMAHLELPYYLGLLSAAEAHGSSHFAVTETQVVTARWIRPITVGRNRLRCFQKANLADTPCAAQQNDWSSVVISSPETTVLDLLRYKVCSPARTLVILEDLVESFRKRRLMDALRGADDTPAGQRMGFLLERAGRPDLADVVAKFLEGRRPRAVDLEPGGRDASERDPRWRLRINGHLEAGA